MAGPSQILHDLAVVLGAAAVTTVVCHRLKQPVVLGYLLAGLLVGPFTPPFAFVRDMQSVTSIADLGVVMLMFSLGLELSLRKLMRVGGTVVLVTLVEVGLMLWLGYSAGIVAGWTPIESLFLGAMVPISSTTIIVKAYSELKRTGRVTHLVFGILVVEDILAVLLLAILTTVAGSPGESDESVLATSLKLGGFLVVSLAVGLLIVPRGVRALVSLGHPETLLVASVGLCFALAFAGQSRGYSPALGAFIAGMLVAESGHGKTVEELVRPIRDMFAAIFFVAVGMLLDPHVLAEHAGIVALIALLTVIGKVIAGSVGAFLGGESTRTSVQVGMSLAQVGEFSFLIAELGISLGVIREFLYSVVIAVCVITTFTTPYLIRASDPFSAWLDRKLPKPLQTFASLYGTWLARIRERKSPGTLGARVRRLALLLLVDVAALTALVIGAATKHRDVAAWLAARVGVPVQLGTSLVVIATLLLGAPFLLGAFRLARAVAVELASSAFPAPTSGVDLGRAPRGALVAALQLAILIVVAVPVVAITQPFLPAFQSGLAFVALLALLSLAFWRSVRDVHGHVSAGAEVIVQTLLQQTAKEEPQRALDETERALPGVGTLARVRIVDGSLAAGATLSALNLRGRSGATAIGILRGGSGIVNPQGDAQLHANDVIVLTGTPESLRAARRILTESP